MADLWQDLRSALRGLQRAPSFTVPTVLTLILGIGANTAIFSAVEAVILHPLPVHGIADLVTIETDIPTASLHDAGLSAGEVYDLVDRRDLFEAIAGYRTAGVNLTNVGDPQRVAAISTIGPFFDVFQIRPYLGRFYTPRDVESGNAHVVVLSHDFWRQLTGGDRSAIGTTLQLDDQSYEVVGVLPPGFRYPRGVQIWTPQPLAPFLGRGERCCLVVPTIARPHPGVSLPKLRAELAVAMAGWQLRLPQFYPSQNPQRLVARSFVEALAGQLRPILLLLIGAGGFVLVIACANVASLQLVRTVIRSKEIAVRAALGAGRPAIVRQLATETLLLAVTGGLAGLVLGALLIRWIGRSDAAQFATLGDLRLDPLVLIFSVGVTLVAATLFGVASTLRAANVNAGGALSDAGARGASAGTSRNRVLRTAVVLQIALALVLILDSAVARQSLARLLAVDPGFRPDGVLTMRLALPASRYGEAARKLAFHDRL